jgi:UDP-N-acetylmuramoyl-L-alanyl-D-glutamate--2,6-diaminopimelate ligase
VDFAHTPDALGSACEAAREALGEGGRLLVVFGCGGARAPGTRPEMGAAVKAAANQAFMTSDNPRSEDPELILDAIEAGFHAAEGTCELWRNADRRAAIAAAVAEAHAGDVILIAGKGHETVQIINTERREFDDRRVARELLA